MARVNVTIHDEIWTDWRAPALAEALGLPRVADAVGRLAWLWRWCLDKRASVAPRVVVESLLGKGGADALVACELADPVEGGLRVHGASARIEARGKWLQQKTDAGLSRADRADSRGERFRGQFCNDPSTNTSDSPAGDQRKVETEDTPLNRSETYKTTSDPPATNQRPTSEKPAFLDLGSGISEISDLRSQKRESTQVKTAKTKTEEGRSASLRSGSQATPSPRGRREFSDEDVATAKRILGYFTRKNGVQYQGSTAHVRLIRARLQEGLTEHDLRCVVGYAWDSEGLNWASATTRDGIAMSRYLKPDTLFGPQSIHRYLDPARDWYRRHVAPNLPPEEQSSTEKPLNGTHSPTVLEEILGKPHDRRRH